MMTSSKAGALHKRSAGHPHSLERNVLRNQPCVRYSQCLLLDAQKAGPLSSPAFSDVLAPKLQRFEKALITLLFSVTQVIKQLAATRDHFKQTTAGGVIL